MHNAPPMHAEYHVDELEHELADAMLQDFNTECEDGSPRQVRRGCVGVKFQACVRA